MKKPKMKLTAISVNFRGQTVQAFRMCEIDERGRAICPADVINNMANQAGCTQRGSTYTFG
jgi:hypothetical protein